LASFVFLNNHLYLVVAWILLTSFSKKQTWKTIP